MNPLSLLCLIPFVAGAPQYYYAPQRVAANAYSGYPYQVSTYQNAPQVKSFVNLGSFNSIPFTRNIPDTTAYGRYQNQVSSYPAYTSKVNSFGNVNALTSNINSVDIIAETRALSNQVQTTLRQFAADPSSAAIANKIIKENPNMCVKNLEEGIASIETATQLLEENERDINKLMAKVNSIGTFTDASTIVRAVADLIRTAEPLSKKLNKENNFGCAASFANEFSFNNQIPLSVDGRYQLKNSANTISAMKSFLAQLRSSFIKFSETCTADKKFNIEAISEVGDIISKSAEVFGTLGGIQKGTQISKGKEYVNKIVAQLKKIENLGFGTIDCTNFGDFSVAASTMTELAALIDEVGIEDLEKQLGVDLSFTF